MKDLNEHLTSHFDDKTKLLGFLRRLKIPVDLTREQDRISLHETIQKTITKLIGNAPVLSNEKESYVAFPKESAIVFEFPEDSHVMMLFERQLFDALLLMRKNTELQQHFQIPDQYLMYLDPEFPKKATYKDFFLEHQYIQGETILGHELQHAIAAQEYKEKNIFIAFTFQVIEDQQGKKELHMHAQVMRIGATNLDSSQMIDVLLAPNIPSMPDIQMAAPHADDIDLPSSRIQKDVVDTFVAIWRDTRGAQLGVC